MLPLCHCSFVQNRRQNYQTTFHGDFRLLGMDAAFRAGLPPSLLFTLQSQLIPRFGGCNRQSETASTLAGRRQHGDVQYRFQKRWTCFDLKNLREFKAGPKSQQNGYYFLVS